MAGTALEGEIIYVDADANGLNDGSSWTNAYNYLQNGLADAKSSAKPVEIRVAQGIYKPDQGTGITPGDRTSAFQLINGVTIKGGYAGFGEPDPNARDVALYQTILSGDIGTLSDKRDNCYHVFYHPEGLNLDNTAILEGFTITGGNANGDWPHYCGGGMYNYKSSPTVEACTFIDNSAIGGGGMYNENGSPTITNCRIAQNMATTYWGMGGGILLTRYASPTIRNCTISGNIATFQGGGIYTADGAYPTIINSNISGNYVIGPDANVGGGIVVGSYGHLRMSNCIISGNSSDQNGGGICIANRQGDCTIASCTITNNSAAEWGGGVLCSRSNPTMNNCTFSGNSASWGGGMCNAISSPTVEGCTFSGNSANEYGGGMLNHNNSSPTVNNCTFSNNTATQRGGGIVNWGGSPTVVCCTFSNNTATQRGGGIDNWGGSPTVVCCTFIANSAEYNGGGMWNEYSSPTVSNCTFVYNYAPNGPAVAFDSYQQRYPSNVIMANSIVWNGSDWLWNNDLSTITVSYSDVQGGWRGRGNINTNPRFVDSANGNYHLLPDSPCINVGDPAFVPEPDETDMDGEARVMFGRIDMGADEFNPIRLGIVSKKRVARTEFAYDCNATFTNLYSFAVRNVELQMMQASENMTIIEPNVTFGDIEISPGESATSIDTCTFQVDRSEAIEPDKIVWKVKCQRSDTGMPLELTINGVSSGGLESIYSNLSTDEKNGLDDLAKLLGQWLWVGPAGSIKEDVTGDGIVNLRDFAELVEHRLEEN